MEQHVNASRKRSRADAAREKAAARRSAAHRAERRRRLLLAGGSVVAVLVVVAGIIIASLLGDGGSSKGKAQGMSAPPAQVIEQTTGVPASALAQVGAAGAGSIYQMPKPLSGAPALTANGKPEVFYDGAEFCPFCAAQRWPMVVALSRFGTFTGLGATTSSSSDVYPDTPTFSFVGSHYTSPYLTFTPVEDRDRTGQPLQKLTDAQQKLLATYDAPPYVQQGGIPFIDFGGKFLQVSASYDPAVLKDKSMREIAAALDNPESKIAQSIDGAANALTATICSVTNNQPSTVCAEPFIQTLQARLVS